MAIFRDTRYPGRWVTRTTNYPQGAFKNKSAPNASDGSYAEEDWLNDWDGFFGRLITVAGVTPNGNVDNATSSQYFTALMKVVSGRLSAKVVSYSSAGTYSYTPSSGVTFFRVIIIGAGGSGGGCGNGTSSGAGGGSGAFAMKTIQVVSGTSYTVTVGSGGASVSGGVSGNDGGATSFSTIITASGGKGASHNSTTSTSGGPGGAASGGDLNINGSDGSDGQNGTFIFSGNGAPSFWGGGARAGQINGVSAVIPGSGGGGVYDSSSSTTARTSGKGADGMVIIEEYY